MIISSNIKKYREEKHFTQEELANRMNISRQSISKWERGDSLPSVDNLISLSELLDLSLDELIMNRGELPLPLHFGKFKSNKIFVYCMLLPMLFILYGLLFLPYTSSGWVFIACGFFMGALFNEINFVDFRRMYNYFTVTKMGIEYFYQKRYSPKIINEIKALFGKRKVDFISYQELGYMEIYFNNKGFQGHNTSLAYRPRQFYYNREQLLLILHTKKGEKIELNLDVAYFPDSDERHYFNAMFDYFDSRGVRVEDPYHILDSIKNEYSIIEEAYKLKKQ